MTGKASLRRWLAAAVGLLAAWTDARGEGLSLYLEPTFTMTHLETQDQLGNGTQQDFKTLRQNYRLNFDRMVSPAFTIGAGGLLEARRTWADDASGARTLDGNLRGLYGRLTMNLPTLTSGLSYDLNSEQVNALPSLVNETLSFYTSWRPLDLPELNLRLSRTHQYDTSRISQDLTTWSALGSIRYIIDPFEFRYVLQWARPQDAITGTEASSLDQTLQGIYSARLFEGRTAVYVSLTLRNQMLKLLSAGSGTVSLQQHPVAGLSLVEVFPALPESDTLLPNPALIDGNLVVSAAVDIGYAPVLAGDDNRRDLGVQFADVITPVNTVQVWVDKKLPPELAIAYTWAAYQSDDNRTWTPVSITGPVVFGAFQNRFEIPVRETRARYLKVVTRPLPSGLTVDPAFANVFVTEVQVFLVQSADSVPLERVSSGALLNATASTLLWRAANLSWDVTALGERRTSPGLTTWSLTNSFTASQWLARGLQLNERLARQDGDEGLGHYGQTDWSAGILWRPLPTFTGSFIYSGQFIDSRPTLDVDTGAYVILPVGFNHSISTLARADLYEGTLRAPERDRGPPEPVRRDQQLDRQPERDPGGGPEPLVVVHGRLALQPEPPAGARRAGGQHLDRPRRRERDGPAHQRDLGGREHHPDRLRRAVDHLRDGAAQLRAASRRPAAERVVLEDLRHRRPVHPRALHARRPMERPPGHPAHRHLYPPQLGRAGEPDPLPVAQPGPLHPPLTLNLRYPTEANMRSLRTTLLVPALLVALAAGCAKTKAYQDRTMDFGAIKTVVVMPFWNLSANQQAADRVRDVFANALLSTQAVYVVPTGEVARAATRLGLATAATPSTEEVVKIGTMLKADAVITGRGEGVRGGPHLRRCLERRVGEPADARDRHGQGHLVRHLDQGWRDLGRSPPRHRRRRAHELGHRAGGG